MPQITLTDAFQDVSSLGELREFFLAGAADGVVLAVEAGASLGASDGAEIGRLSTPNPGTSGAAGTTTFTYPGSAQFLRYRVVEGVVGGAAAWVSGAARVTPPQVTLTTSFQDLSSLGSPRELFLSGAPAGTVVAVEAGASLIATAGVEVARLQVPNPSSSGADGACAGYAGSAQFLRYRVLSADPLPGGAAVWAAGSLPEGVDGATVYATLPVGDAPGGGYIGGLSAAETVDRYSSFAVGQVSPGQALLLRAPTDTTPGRLAYVMNAGTVTFSMYGKTINTGLTPLTASAWFIWNGFGWVASA